MSDNETAKLHAKLLGETARITWPELERLFASGKLIRVAPELDLIEVGKVLARDDATRLKAWMQQEQTGLLDDAAAQRWASHEDCELWALVVSPWVLVQERARDE